LFCVAVGTGYQLLSSAIATGVFSALGFLSPANRGSLFIAAISLFCLFSFGGAFHAGRLHKKFRGASWVQCGVLMATGFPGLCFLVFVIANILLHVLKSSGAVPLSKLRTCALVYDVVDVASHILLLFPATMFAVTFFWLAVAAPLALGGSYMGYMKDPPIEFPLQSDTMPRPIPEQPWFLGLGPTVWKTHMSTKSALVYIFCFSMRYCFNSPPIYLVHDIFIQHIVLFTDRSRWYSAIRGMLRGVVLCSL
jgi:transmembrane 9 superfamily member 2/4